MTPRGIIVRVALMAVFIITVSALAKGVLFGTALEPDETGRQPVEQHREEGAGPR